MRLPFALWCCFVIKGTFYASFLPLWEGYDESSHFSFVEHLATHSRLPNPITGIPRDVSASLQLTPVPWTIKDWEPGWITHDDFWQLSSWEIHRRESLLRSVIPAGFMLARKAGLNYWRAIAVVGATAAAAELMMTAAHVSNEALALALATVCVVVWMRLCAKPRRPLIGSVFLGLLLGCCLLTKAYFLALLPAVFGTLLTKPGRAVVAVVVAAGVSGWWYAHNVATTKTLSGEQSEVAAERSGVSLASAARQVHWRLVADFAIASHIWIGGRSLLTLRGWMYRAIELLLLAALAGMCLQLMRPVPLPPDGLRLTILLLPQCLFWIGLAYRALASYRSTRVAGTLRYYPWCLAVPEVLCLLAGIERIAPARFQAFCAPLVTICFGGIEIFSSNFLLIPYYTGLTVHSPGGGVPAAHVSALWNAFPEPLLSRLAFAKPFPLTVPAMLTLWLLFFLAVLARVGISILSSWRSEKRARPDAFATRLS
jgi:hypothetical protein